MQNRHIPFRKPVLFFAATLMLAVGITPLRAQVNAPLSAKAQARADRQIAAVMKDKADRTPAQNKMDSHLIYAAREATAGKALEGLPKYRPNVKLDSDGSVEVVIKGQITPDLLAAIAAQGGKIVISHPEYSAVRVTLPLLNVEAIAARPEVRFIAPPPKMVLHTGSVNATSDTTMLAAQARMNYGVTGAGVSVGVISDSIDSSTGSLAAAYASGDLDPNNTFIIPGQSGGMGSGEGGAMMQIIHDIAPGSPLYFATAFNGSEQFAANIRAMAAAGCRVICDDVTGSDESPFQDQVIAQAVGDFCAAGGMYFSATGNGGNKEQNSATIWEGDFKDGGDASAIEGAGARYHAFTMDSGATVNGDVVTGNAGGNLFWSDPLGASTNDYDLFEVSPAGVVVQMSTNTQDGTQDPNESFSAGPNSGDSLVIVKQGAAAPRFLHLEAGEGTSLAITTNGNLRGHNGPAVTTGMFSTASTDSSVAFPNAFNSGNVTETGSSDGPRRMFYLANGTPFTAGNFSSTGGRVFAHPDLTAADGVNTSDPRFAPFYGTSAAAPHAAAVAALLLSKFPNLTPVQADAAMRAGVVKNNQSAATVGAGILLVPNVLAAAAAQPPPVVSSFTASGPVGSTVSLTGNNFLGMSKVAFFRNVTAPTFTVISNTQMTVVVPTGARTGVITLTTTGSNTTSTKFTVTP